MKYKIFLMVIIASIFIGCKTEDSEEQPIAQFTYSVNDKTVTFKNQSLHAQKYFWTFGDHSGDPAENPVKTYSEAGTYQVTLVATNITKSDTCYETLVISDAEPQAIFSYTTNGLEVSFKNTSTYAQSYSWDFGDGKNSTLKEPSHSYNSPGTYTVILTAINGEKSNSTSKSITVNYKQPSASFTYKTVQPLKVILTNTSSNAISYEWDFGDGTTSTEKNPTHRYSGIGVYRIKLTAKGHNNMTNKYETNVTIEAPTKCYMTGFTITKIPNNNYYYQLQLTDDYVMSKTTYFFTDWYLLSSANLPFYHQLKSQKLLDISKTYVLRMYKDSSKPSGQASGKGFWTASLTPQVLGSYPEILACGNVDNTMVNIEFLWE